MKWLYYKLGYEIPIWLQEKEVQLTFLFWLILSIADRLGEIV